MQEDDPEEARTRHAMWLEEKVASLQKEKEAMEVTIQELEGKIAPQKGFIKDVVQRCRLIEGAITRIAYHIENQKLSMSA